MKYLAVALIIIAGLICSTGCIERQYYKGDPSGIEIILTEDGLSINGQDVECINDQTLRPILGRYWYWHVDGCDQQSWYYLGLESWNLWYLLAELEIYYDYRSEYYHPLEFTGTLRIGELNVHRDLTQDEVISSGLFISNGYRTYEATIGDFDVEIEFYLDKESGLSWLSRVDIGHTYSHRQEYCWEKYRDKRTQYPTHLSWNDYYSDWDWEY